MKHSAAANDAVPAGPPPELVKQFRQLEQRIDAVLALVAQLQRENQELRQRLAAADQKRQAAIDRLNTILDSIEALR